MFHICINVSDGSVYVVADQIRLLSICLLPIRPVKLSYMYFRVQNSTAILELPERNSNAILELSDMLRICVNVSDGSVYVIADQIRLLSICIRRIRLATNQTDEVV